MQQNLLDKIISNYHNLVPLITIAELEDNTTNSTLITETGYILRNGTKHMKVIGRTTKSVILDILATNEPQSLYADHLRSVYLYVMGITFLLPYTRGFDAISEFYTTIKHSPTSIEHLHNEYNSIDVSIILPYVCAQPDYGIFGSPALDEFIKSFHTLSPGKMLLYALRLTELIISTSYYLSSTNLLLNKYRMALDPVKIIYEVGKNTSLEDYTTTDMQFINKFTTITQLPPKLAYSEIENIILITNTTHTTSILDNVAARYANAHKHIANANRIIKKILKNSMDVEASDEFCIVCYEPSDTMTSCCKALLCNNCHNSLNEGGLITCPHCRNGTIRLVPKE